MSGEPDPHLPPRLVEALKRHDGKMLPDTATLDQEIDAAAELHFNTRRRGWWIGPRSAVAGLAAAAALGLVVWIQPWQSSDPQPMAAGPAPADLATTPLSIRGDINADGTVDIIDALVLARAVESDQPSEAIALIDADFNGDGVVDSLDADTLATGIVRLEGGSS